MVFNDNSLSNCNSFGVSLYNGYPAQSIGNGTDNPYFEWNYIFSNAYYNLTSSMEIDITNGLEYVKNVKIFSVYNQDRKNNKFFVAIGSGQWLKNDKIVKISIKAGTKFTLMGVK